MTLAYLQNLRKKFLQICLKNKKKSDNNIKLNNLSKETDNLKLKIETSQESIDGKFKGINKKLKNDKQQHGNEIDELWKEN